jgi:hypothetical protein
MIVCCILGRSMIVCRVLSWLMIVCRILRLLAIICRVLVFQPRVTRYSNPYFSTQLYRVLGLGRAYRHIFQSNQPTLNSSSSIFNPQLNCLINPQVRPENSSLIWLGLYSFFARASGNGVIDFPKSLKTSGTD